MTASELRGMTGGAVLACSPVVLATEDGRRFELIGRAVECPAVVTDAETGQKRPGAVPVLTLIVREVTPP